MSNPHFLKYFGNLNKINQLTRKFLWHNCRNREYGMLFQDTYSEFNPVVEEAVRRLPSDLYDARQERVIRATFLNMKNEILPRDQWVKFEDDTFYLEPYLREVEDEIRQHTYYRSKKPFWATHILLILHDLLDLSFLKPDRKKLLDLMNKRDSSARLKESDQKKILDSAVRHRRLKKQLEALELDNYQDDPHANLTWHKKMPKFDDASPSKEKESKSQKRKDKRKSDHLKIRFKRTFQQLLEEEKINAPDRPNYFSSQAPPSRYPQRHFCAVCGLLSCYSCIQCGARYCCLKCLTLHKDTRCLKWTA